MTYYSRNFSNNNTNSFVGNPVVIDKMFDDIARNFSEKIKSNLITILPDYKLGIKIFIIGHIIVISLLVLILYKLFK